MGTPSAQAAAASVAVADVGIGSVETGYLCCSVVSPRTAFSGLAEQFLGLISEYLLQRCSVVIVATAGVAAAAAAS